MAFPSLPHTFFLATVSEGLMVCTCARAPTLPGIRPGRWRDAEAGGVFGLRSSSLGLAACPNLLDLSSHAWKRQPEALLCLLSGSVVEIRQHDGKTGYVFYAVSSRGSETRCVLFDVGNKVRRGNITFPSYPQPTDESWKQAE